MIPQAALSNFIRAKCGYQCRYH